MNRLVAFAFFLLCTLDAAASFSLITKTNNNKQDLSATPRAPLPVAFQLTTTTALQMAADGDDDDETPWFYIPPVSTSAMYIASAAFAILLPLIFLVAGSGE